MCSLFLIKNINFEEHTYDMEACKFRKKRIKVNVEDKQFEEGYEEDLKCDFNEFNPLKRIKKFHKIEKKSINAKNENT